MVGQQWLKSYQTKDLFDQSTSSVSDGDVDSLVVQENQVRMSTFNSECKLTGTLACNQEFRKCNSVSVIGYVCLRVWHATMPK